MKLLAKTSLYLLLAALPVAIGGAFLFYSLIHRAILQEVDELLVSQLRQTEQQMQQRPPMPGAVGDWDNNPQIEAKPSAFRLQPTFSDTTEIDLREQEPVSVRLLRASVRAGGATYQVTIRQAYAEFDEIARALSVGVIVCFLSLVGVLLGLDVLIARRVWQPFYQIIDQLRSYRLDGTETAPFPTSQVPEFALLSQSLHEMTHNLRQQYQLQKQFTENASHEMQTPLAIASAELELLSQSAQLSETNWERMQRATDAIRRLSQQNRSLLLLARIENKQFGQRQPVDLSQLVHKLLSIYADFAVHKNLRFDSELSPDCLIDLNPQLAEVLLTNLIKNTIRHSRRASRIRVELTSLYFRITNSGDPLPFPAEHLFERFRRNPAQSDSTGLGLALVKQIADAYAMPLTHAYDSVKQTHTFTVTFRPTPELL